jgi:hypothetical protein
VQQDQGENGGVRTNAVGSSDSEALVGTGSYPVHAECVGIGPWHGGQPTCGPWREENVADSGAPCGRFSNLKKPKNLFPHEKNSHRIWKNLVKFVEVQNPNLYTFHY